MNWAELLAFDLAVNVAFYLALIFVVSGLEALLPFRAALGGNNRWWTNLGLTVLFFTVNAVLTFFLVSAARDWAGPGFGLLAGMELSFLACIAIAILALDFSTYLAHRWMHTVPLLWRFHRVHHIDTQIDATTAFREHPLECAWRFTFTLVPAIALGLPAEAVAIYRMTSGINAVFEHMDVKLWPPLDRLLVLLFVTPNMHKLHHSRIPAETDSNYANLLSINDRLFGSFTSPELAHRCDYGLDGYHGGEGIGTLLKLPARP